MPLQRSATFIALATVGFLASVTTLTRALPQATSRNSTPEEAMQDTRPADCRVTLPADGRFTPPPTPFNGGSGHLVSSPVLADGVFRFWFGSEKLWTILPTDGTWRGWYTPKPGDYAYSDKLPWFRIHPAFSGRDGQLTVEGKRLDRPAPSFASTFSSNGFRNDDDNAMIMGGINISTFGCWEITGRYKDQELTFTVWVAAPPENKVLSGKPPSTVSEAPAHPTDRDVVFSSAGDSFSADTQLAVPKTSGEYNDSKYGISVKLPAGWTFAGVERWGDQQNTVRLTEQGSPSVRAALYYKIFTSPQKVIPDKAGQLPRDITAKVNQRKREGFDDYRVRADSYEQRTVDGRSATSWMADYTDRGQTMSEYLIRVRTDRVNALFYASTPTGEFDSSKQRFDQIVETLEIP